MGYTQPALIATGVVFPAIGFVLVCLRFWMRHSFQRTYIGIDDWCILFASILVIGMAVNSILGSYIGLMGMDGLEIDESRELPQKKLDFSVLVFEKPAYGAIKLSVLLFYRRIFTVKKFRNTNNVLIAVIVAWTLAFFFADLFACGANIEANWDPKAKAKAHCINIFVMLLVFAITDVLTDVSILWMPYPQIKKLQMSSRDKWALSGVFLLGAIDLVIGIVRLGFIVANQTVPAVESSFNPPEQTAPTFWTVLEVGIGVIAANLPALAPLLRDRAKTRTMFSSLRSKLLGSNKNSTAATATVTKGNVPMTFEHLSDEETRIGSVDVRAHPSMEDKHKSEHVGMWDQFERLDERDVAEVQTPPVERTHNTAL